MSKKEEPSFKWDVRVEDSLRVPITTLAIKGKVKIREVVNTALREYLEKHGKKGET